MAVVNMISVRFYRVSDPWENHDDYYVDLILLSYYHFVNIWAGGIGGGDT